VFTLRCTARLTSRLRVEPGADASEPVTLLGDWYANLVHVGRQQFVLAVSDRTFLPVVIAAAPSATLVPRLRAALVDLLGELGVQSAAIKTEEAAMTEWTYGKTISKQVLGVLVDFAKALPYYLEDDPSLLFVALKLAHTPMSPLFKTSVFPDRATTSLFSDAN
jgi:hypothetical protein